MPRRRPRRPIFIGFRTSGLNNKAKAFICFALAAVMLIVPAVKISGYIRQMATEIAITEVTDMITHMINETIHEIMSSEEFDYNYFVTLEKGADGGITAITTNMARINKLSSELLQKVIDDTGTGMLDVSIPVGNLLGFNLLLGRGPEIPVKITILTSSFADFRNELESVEINQTKHRIILEIFVQIYMLVPWESITTEVMSEVLIAETVIVGKVPDTYLSMGTTASQSEADAE